MEIVALVAQGYKNAGLQEQGDHSEALYQRADGEEPSGEHLPQARRLRPLGAGALRLAPGLSTGAAEGIVPEVCVEVLQTPTDLGT